MTAHDFRAVMFDKGLNASVHVLRRGFVGLCQPKAARKDSKVSIQTPLGGTRISEGNFTCLDEKSKPAHSPRIARSGMNNVPEGFFGAQQIVPSHQFKAEITSADERDRNNFRLSAVSPQTKRTWVLESSERETPMRLEHAQKLCRVQRESEPFGWTWRLHPQWLCTPPTSVHC